MDTGKRSPDVLMPRHLGASGPWISAIGLGTMSWPGCRYGDPHPAGLPRPPREIITMVETAISLGINLIDTAEGYGCGLAEEFLGSALHETGLREYVRIVTKTGPLFGADRNNGRTCNLSHGHLFERVDSALRRLKVDRIDVLLAHWPDDQTPIGETMAAASELRAAGKIAHFGASNFSAQLLEEALSFGPVVCNQLPCSLADRTIEDGRRQSCLAHGVGIMAYSPLGKGILGGKYNVSHLPPSGDYRLERPHFTNNLERNLLIANRLETIAADFDTVPAAVALAWTLHLPGVTVAIPGAKSVTQIREHAVAPGLLGIAGFTEELDKLSIDFAP